MATIDDMIVAMDRIGYDAAEVYKRLPGYTPR